MTNLLSLTVITESHGHGSRSRRNDEIFGLLTTTFSCKFFSFLQHFCSSSFVSWYVQNHCFSRKLTVGTNVPVQNTMCLTVSHGQHPVPPTVCLQHVVLMLVQNAMLHDSARLKANGCGSYHCETVSFLIQNEMTVCRL